jgi:hypothetical protein
MYNTGAGHSLTLAIENARSRATALTPLLRTSYTRLDYFSDGKISYAVLGK